MSTLLALKLWAEENFTVVTALMDYVATTVTLGEDDRQLERFIYYHSEQLFYGIASISGLGSRTGQSHDPADHKRWILEAVKLAGGICSLCQDPLVLPSHQVREADLDSRLSVGAWPRR